MENAGEKVYLQTTLRNKPINDEMIPGLAARSTSKHEKAYRFAQEKKGVFQKMTAYFV